MKLSGKNNTQTWFKICYKLIVCCVTFIAILSAGLISKGAIFFMTSSMSRELAQLSPVERPDDAGSYHNLDRFLCWMWALVFTFAVPEIFAFLQSLHVCFFRRRNCWKRPRFVDFSVIFLLETAQTIGMALLFGFVLPCLLVVHGILITTCLYLMPALFNFLSRKPDEPKRMAKMAGDGLSFAAQLSGCLHWIFIRNHAEALGNSYEPGFIERQRIVDWMLPVSLVLISLGWWENYVDKDASVGLIRSLGRIKQSMKTTQPLSQIFISLWKISVFLGTTLILADVAFTAQDRHTLDSNNLVPLFLAVRHGFIQFWSSAMSLDWNSPFYVFAIQSVASLLFYSFGMFACNIGVQRSCFAFPVVLVTPGLILIWAVTLTDLLNMCDDCFPDAAQYFIHIDYQQPVVLLALAFIWFLSQIWITLHIWKPVHNSSDVEISDTKWYSSLVIEQQMGLSLAHRPDCGNLNTTGPGEIITSRVFAVVTMWHESNEEMLTILKSIFLVDTDQCERRVACDQNKVIDPHLYHYETHIFFDDAFESHSHEGKTSREVNQFVNDFIAMVHKMSCTSLQSPTLSTTPYGGRLEWILPGKTKMAVHLKDKTKVGIKKRWSQVMYIDYVIRYEMAEVVDLTNVFLLSLDGDMDFRPKAIHTLVDVMNSQRDVGIVCNRSHPTGSAGAMVWYQMFEYAIGFWLLKPSEDFLGCILCAPGCFCLIRASILLDKEVMNKFNALSKTGQHIIQRDQGEDRWLCTLLIKQGHRVAYSASSYADTHCPETFDEFYNQRRRWVLSIFANTMDVLLNCRQIVRMNPNISWLYIVFQAALLIMYLLCPGSIFFALVNTSATIFLINPWISLMVHSALIVIFVVTCYVASARVQLVMAKSISALYALILGIVVIKAVVSMTGNFGIETSWSIHNVFFLSMAICIFLAGCLHPHEIHCLLAGPIYLLFIPSMSMLHLLYSIINMNVVSWGTRDSNSSETTGPPSTDTVAQTMKDSSNSNEGAVDNAVAPSMSTVNHHPTYTSDHQPGKIGRETSVSMTSVRGANEKDGFTTNEVFPDWNFETDATLSKQIMDVKRLSEEENGYWNDLIAQKLFPIVESNQDLKQNMSNGLVRLRNLSFACFFFLNSLFVALMFGMQVHSEFSISQVLSGVLNDSVSSSHHEQEESTRTNEGWFLRAHPVQIVLVFLAGSMFAIQFTALLKSRVDNLIRILSPVQFGGGSTANSDNAISYRAHQVVLTSYNLAANQNDKNSSTYTTGPN